MCNKSGQGYPLRRVGDFRRIILVTGTPGVGKTSVSTFLASRLEAVRIDLAQLVQTEDLASGVDKVRGSLIADIARVSRRVKEIMENCEDDIVIDGHYAVDVVPAKNVHLVFVLRRNPDELKRSLEDKGFTGRKLWENLEAEILDVCLWDAVKACGTEKVCEIDTSGKTVERVVTDIFLVLEGKENCRNGTVDWLGKLESEGRLDDFLKSCETI